ncbi:putative quinol monooxygenase [Mycoplasmopsis opalescens]|uniref:putative quinol monooxygenase n=1 Tax=Mycoplasmopsis opalescens TaxID=114886 RepID=UPI0004A720A5|nr:antibiotic biosynthesis monooxygenase [Mycoplasmopsis opalescens]
MVYLVIKEFNVHKEMVNNFEKFVLEWVYKSEREPLNLSIDTYLKGHIFTIIERWTTEKAYVQFTNKNEYKDFYEQVKQYIISDPKVFKTYTNKSRLKPNN